MANTYINESKEDKRNLSHEKIAEFVNNYEEHIKPLFDEEKLNYLEIKKKINWICNEFMSDENRKYIQENSDSLAFVRYKFANEILVGLGGKQKLPEGKLKHFASIVDQHVSDLEDILSEDTHYQEARRKLE